MASRITVDIVTSRESNRLITKGRTQRPASLPLKNNNNTAAHSCPLVSPPILWLYVYVQYQYIREITITRNTFTLQKNT